MHKSPSSDGNSIIGLAYWKIHRIHMDQQVLGHGPLSSSVLMVFCGLGFIARGKSVCILHGCGMEANGWKLLGVGFDFMAQILNSMLEICGSFNCVIEILEMGTCTWRLSWCQREPRAHNKNSLCHINS